MSPDADVSTGPAAAVVGQVEEFLEDALVQMRPDPGETARDGPGRPRVLPSLALWAGMLVCVLRGFTGQRAVWRLLNQLQLWFYPRFAVTDQAVYKRLAVASTAPLVAFFEQISSVLQKRLAPYAIKDLAPFASEVVALDETTLDQVARVLPALRKASKGDKRLLPGKLAGLFDVRGQQWLKVEHIENPNQNEKVAARGLVETLAKSSLILADLGYFGFAWFDDLTDMGHHWISRLRSKTSHTLVHVYYQNGSTFDGIIWLGAHRADRAAHAVRLVRFRVGDHLYSFVTNVMDPGILSAREIARLYARRWDFELAVNLIKRHLNLHILWAAKTPVIVQQVWVVLTISQILQALRMEIAGRANVDPFDVSMPLLVEYMPQCAYTRQDPVELFVTRGRELGFIRPSRRTVIHAPDIPPEQITPLPLGLALEREPRYANRKCGPRSATPAPVPAIS